MNDLINFSFLGFHGSTCKFFEREGAKYVIFIFPNTGGMATLSPKLILSLPPNMLPLSITKKKKKKIYIYIYIRNKKCEF